MKKIGRYNIVAELGRGAMGIVYRAEDPTIGRQVALKVLSFGNAEVGAHSPQELFMREVRAAGRLAHPSIVTIHDAFEDPQTRSSCIVMELVPGRTLESILLSGERLAPEETLDVVRQVAEGLDYAHRHQVVHRDLKPANILVTPDGHVKITDFGIAKVLAREGVARTIGMMGTPSYMSPEQVRGGDIDARADVFSLGVIFYLMLTGQKPFLGDTAAVMFKVVYEDPPAPSNLNLRLNHAYDAVVLKCLAKDRDQRYPSVRAFLDDLDRLTPRRPAQPGATAEPVDDGTLELTMPALSASWSQRVPLRAESAAASPAPQASSGPQPVPNEVPKATSAAPSAATAGSKVPIDDGALELTMPALSAKWSEDLAKQPVRPVAAPPPVPRAAAVPAPAIAPPSPRVPTPSATRRMAAVLPSSEATVAMPGTAFGEPLPQVPPPPVAPAPLAKQPPSASVMPSEPSLPEGISPVKPEFQPAQRGRANNLLIVLGAFGILLLAAAGVGLWKYHQIMSAEVSPPRIARIPPPSVPPELQPTEPVAPAAAAEKPSPQKAKKKAKEQVKAPEPAPAPPPQPVVATPAPELPPPTPSAEEIAKANAARLASLPRIVQLHCDTDLKEATYTISAGGQTLFQTVFKGKKKGGFLGIKGSYEGTFSRTVTVPPGAPEVSVHIVTKDKATDLGRVIPMPAAGGFVPTLKVAIEDNKVSLAWETGSASKM